MTKATRVMLSLEASAKEPHTQFGQLVFCHSTETHNLSLPFFRPSTYISMPCLGSARVVFDFPAVSVWLSLRRPRSSPRSFRVSYSSSITTPTRWPPRREFSIIAHLRSDFLSIRQGGGCKSHTMLLYGICLTRDLICSASTVTFATQSADLSSTSMS